MMAVASERGSGAGSLRSALDRGWLHVKRLARRAIPRFVEDRCTQLAASVSFYVLFSIFPLLILLVAIFGLIVQDVGSRTDVINAILEGVPLSQDEGRRDLERLLEGATTARALGVASILVLLWSASAMMASIRNGMNVVWRVETRRPPAIGKLVDAGMVVALGVVVAASLGFTVLRRIALENPDENLGAVGSLVSAVAPLAWLVPLALSFATFAFVYAVVPAVRLGFRDVWPGALVAAILYEVAKNGFALYVANLNDYTAVYGSLGAVVAFLFFVYLAANVLFFGAEVAVQWPGVRAGRRGASAIHDPLDDAPALQRAARRVRPLFVHDPPDEDGIQEEER